MKSLSQIQFKFLHNTEAWATAMSFIIKLQPFQQLWDSLTRDIDVQNIKVLSNIH